MTPDKATALREAAARATPGPWGVVTDEDGLDFIVSATHGLVTTPERDDDPDGRYLATFDPPTVLSILSRLSAAEARVGVLEEALREARISVESWGAYVEPYFQEKHDLAGDLARIDAALTQEPSHEP